MMIQIEDTIISTDIFDKCFCCDLNACKGICCIEGDAGAPLEDEEVEKIKEILPIVWDRLSDDSKEVINSQDFHYKDIDGDTVTSIVNGGKCVFTSIEEDGTCKCALEKAFLAGETDFKKPISCHLYPIRLTQHKSGETSLSVHRWNICHCAFMNGENIKLPIYKFLKEPLVRRFGNDWYEQVCIAAEEIKKIKWA